MFTRWSFTARVSNCFIFLAVGQRFCWMESYRWFPCVAPFQQTIHKVYFAVWPLWKLETTFDYRRRPFQVAQLRKAVTQTRVFRWLCISGQGWSFRFNADDDPCNFFGIFIFFFLMFLFLNFVDENWDLLRGYQITTKHIMKSLNHVLAFYWNICLF